MSGAHKNNCLDMKVRPHMIAAISATTLLTFASICTGRAHICPGNRINHAKMPVVIAPGAEIGFARAFIGGQDVVQVAISDSRRTPFLDVKASDLLISYIYDKKGRLVDRKLWFDTPVQQAAAAKRGML